MSDRGERIRWNPDEPIELEQYMRLSRIEEEDDVSKSTMRASILAAVEEELDVTDEELAIAARVGVTREQLIQQKARDLLNDKELKLESNGAGMTPIQILAQRIVP